MAWRCSSSVTCCDSIAMFDASRNLCTSRVGLRNVLQTWNYNYQYCFWGNAIHVQITEGEQAFHIFFENHGWWCIWGVLVTLGRGAKVCTELGTQRRSAMSWWIISGDWIEMINIPSVRYGSHSLLRWHSWASSLSGQDCLAKGPEYWKLAHGPVAGDLTAKFQENEQSFNC